MPPKRKPNEDLAVEVHEVIQVDKETANSAPKRPRGKRNAAKGDGALSSAVVVTDNDENSSAAAPSAAVPRTPSATGSRSRKPKPAVDASHVTTDIATDVDCGADPGNPGSIQESKEIPKSVAPPKPRGKLSSTHPASAVTDPPSEASSSKAKRPRGKAGSGVTGGPCHDCGLTAPFCAMSGKPHLFAMTPCPKCHQNTLFCGETGERHAPLHGPFSDGIGSAAKLSSKKSRAEVDDAEGIEPPSKKARGDKKQQLLLQLPEQSSEEAAGDADSHNQAKKTVRNPRTKQQSAAKGSEATNSEDSVKGKRQKTLDESLSSKSSTAERLLEGNTPPKPFVYPPLKPILNKLEHAAFVKSLHADDSVVKKRMIDANLNTASQKRYLAFLGMYTSEKGKQEMVAAHKQSVAAGDVVVAAPEVEANPQQFVE